MSDAPVVAAKTPAGVDIEQGKTYYWCRCGRSEGQPFCDGSHVGTGLSSLEFTAERTETVHLCRCKGTANPPYCDGTHSGL